MLILIERNTERRLLWLADFGVGGKGASSFMLLLTGVELEFKVVNGERFIKIRRDRRVSLISVFVRGRRGGGGTGRPAAVCVAFRSRVAWLAEAEDQNGV